MKRMNALLRQTIPVARRAALMKQAESLPPTRRQALLKRVGVAKRLPVPFHNKKGRQFYLTLKGKYVIRTANGKTLYGRKATDPRAPIAIRPKRILK
jgi:hypothetical protein